MFQYLGWAAGILTGVSHIPYLIDIFKKTTKPERASWLIWSVLGSIAFFSQMAEGASNSLWFSGLDTFGVMVTFLLSIKYGVGGLTKTDKIALFAAGLGLIGWYLTRQAAVALIISILIDMTGAGLTIKKAYEDPGSETMITWLGISFASVLAIISVGKIDFVLMLYPVYLFLANMSVAVAMWLSPKRAKNLSFL